MTEVIEDGPASSNLVEVRVGRNVRSATFVYQDKIITFQRRKPKDYRARVRAEGILPFTLLKTVSTFISTNASVPEPVSTGEPDDDDDDA